MNPSSTSPRRILVVDDHAIMREGLKAMIQLEEDLEVCGAASTAEEALGKLTTLKPHLILVDISLPGMDGLECVRILKEQAPQIPSLVLSAHDEKIYAERAVRAGAMGYLMKEAPRETFLMAVRAVLRGEYYLSEELMPLLLGKILQGKMGDQGNPVDCLSDRELEIFRLIGEGIKTREISQKLHLSPKTIQAYRDRIRAKMNLDDGAALQQAAFQHCHSSDV